VGTGSKNQPREGEKKKPKGRGNLLGEGGKGTGRGETSLRYRKGSGKTQKHQLRNGYQNGEKNKKQKEAMG